MESSEGEQILEDEQISRDDLRTLGWVTTFLIKDDRQVLRNKETGQEITWDANSHKIVKGTLRGTFKGTLEEALKEAIKGKLKKEEALKEAIK